MPSSEKEGFRGRLRGQGSGMSRSRPPYMSLAMAQMLGLAGLIGMNCFDQSRRGPGRRCPALGEKFLTAREAGDLRLCARLGEIEERLYAWCLEWASALAQKTSARTKRIEGGLFANSQNAIACFAPAVWLLAVVACLTCSRSIRDETVILPVGYGSLVVRLPPNGYSRSSARCQADLSLQFN